MTHWGRHSPIAILASSFEPSFRDHGRNEHPALTVPRFSSPTTAALSTGSWCNEDFSACCHVRWLEPKSHRLADAWHFSFAGIRCITSQKAGPQTVATSKAQRERQGMKRAVFGFTRPPGQKPDALASMGCPGGWIVMPEATKLSVSMIVSFSAFLPHCKLSDLTDSLSALSI